MGRWFRPAGFVLTGLLFLFPFIAVSCDAPGGYGRAAPGGTTEYSGADFVVGGVPHVSPPDKVREGDNEKIEPQPLAGAALIFVLAGIAVTFAVAQVLTRRASATVLAGAAAIALAANQLTVQSVLIKRITGPMPDGKHPEDFVRTQPGFWVCMTVLIVLVIGYGVGWIRSAARQ